MNPATNAVYVANRGGKVSVINGRTDKVSANIPVGYSLFGIAADPEPGGQARAPQRRAHAASPAA